MTRLRKVVNELVSRKCISTADNLYDMPLYSPVRPDLSSLNIDELHTLYRRRPIRHKEREAEGRESLSFFYEGRIVRELKKRKVANKAAQLKIDYCLATYRNELDNMSVVFSLPVNVVGEKIYTDYRRTYSPEELTALIALYKDYSDITERELLVEYVDYVLDLLKKEEDATSCWGLISEVAELGLRKIIRIPQWVARKLEMAVKFAMASKTDNDADLPLAMLTVPSKYIEFVNRDETVDYDTKMKELQTELKDILRKEAESREAVLDVFKSLGYEIDL